MTSTCYLTFLEAVSSWFRHTALYMYQRNVRERTHYCTRVLLKGGPEELEKSSSATSELSFIIQLCPL